MNFLRTAGARNIVLTPSLCNRCDGGIFVVLGGRGERPVPGAEEGAEKVYAAQRSGPQGLKPCFIAAFTARINPCP